MKDGKYKVIKEINMYICCLGRLVMKEGVIFEISENGKVVKAEGIKISPRFLTYCDGHFIKI